MTQRAAVRGRRLVAALALSVLGVGGLSACQGQPGAAAFVDGTRITVGDVDNSVKDIPAGAPLVKQLGTQYRSILRQVSVQDMVAIELAKRFAAEHGIKPPVADPQTIAQYAEQLSVSPDNDFVQNLVTAQAWTNTLDDSATPVTPTDAELRGIYDRAKAAGITDKPFEGVKGAIAQISGLGQAVAVQRELDAAAKKYGLSVNPRYQPSAELGNPVTSLEMPLLQIQGPGGVPVTVLAVRFGGDNPAVVSEPSTPAGGGQDTGGGQNAP